MQRISRNVMVNGFGCGVGIIQVVATGQYDFALPFFEGIIPHPWEMMSSLGNILIGGVLFSIAQFTKIVKNVTMIDIFTMYGITTLIGGIMNGIVMSTAPVTSMNIPNGYYTSSYYPGFKGTFYRRPETRAKGFGSDVSVNPKAAIPTEVPYNTFLA